MNIEFCNLTSYDIYLATNVSVLKWIQRNLVTKTKVMISYRWPTIKEQKLMRSKMGVCTFPIEKCYFWNMVWMSWWVHM